MKRLRDMPMRMRPMAHRHSGSDGLDGGYGGDAADRSEGVRHPDERVMSRAPFTPPSRDHGGPAPGRTARPVSSRRRAIWDLEQELGRDTATDQDDVFDDAEDHRAEREAQGRTFSRPTSRPVMPRADDTRSASRDASYDRHEEIAPSMDFGHDHAEDEDMASRARRALAEGAQKMAERGMRAPESPAPEPAGTRAPDPAKTRVLGFHGAGLALDPISAVAEKAAGQVRFPTGWLVVTDGPGRGSYFAVTMSVSSIGRGADQAICLNFGDESISRQSHAAIAYDAEQNRFFLGHGNKSNIVRRNEMPVLATEELHDGDTIRIGKTTLRFVALCGPSFTWDTTDDEAGDATGDANV